jgi:hypothetical protein
LIETSVAMAVLGLLLLPTFSMTLETTAFLGDHEIDNVLQAEGNRIFNRLSEVLRKSGRVVVDEVTYPAVVSGGAALEFLVLEDVDGNGHVFDESTGALEWSPTVFHIETDTLGNLGIYQGDELVYHLGRFVRNLNFQTVDGSPSLHLKEIQLYFELQRPTRSGYDMRYVVSGSIHMRNSVRAPNAVRRQAEVTTQPEGACD